MAERWLTDLGDLVSEAERDGIPVLVADHDVIESFTGFHLHRGALASMQRPELRSVADVVAGAHRVLVIEDVVDHTNVGAVFRSAAALGMDAVLVTPVAAAIARVSTCGRTVRSREVRSEVLAAAYSSARAGTYSAVVSRRPSGAAIRSAR